jgi:molybdopterin-guanine dinucleotide biosynthesis protein B
MYPENPQVIGLASDEPVEARVPVLDLNNPERIAEFILEHAV